LTKFEFDVIIILMIKISLIKIDLENIEDQKFLYEILKFRYSKSNIINVKYKCSSNLPSFEDHVKYITSGKYKIFYKINFGDITIGSVYVDKRDINGTIIIPSKLKKALKKYKDKDLEISKMPISALIHFNLFKLHPEIETHYASVNPNNILSINALIQNGYEHIESIFSMKTKNGKALQGKWVDYE